MPPHRSKIRTFIYLSFWADNRYEPYPLEAKSNSLIFLNNQKNNLEKDQERLCWLEIVNYDSVCECWHKNTVIKKHLNDKLSRSPATTSWSSEWEKLACHESQNLNWKQWIPVHHNILSWYYASVWTWHFQIRKDSGILNHKSSAKVKKSYWELWG